MNSRIFWYTKKLVDSARDFDTDEPLTDAQKNARLKGFAEGDRVALIYVDGKAAASERIRQGTVWGAMTAIARGLNKTVPKDCPTLEKMINLFFRQEDRQRLLAMHKKGTLKFKYLTGEYEFFSTPFKKEGNIWVYTLES